MATASASAKRSKTATQRRVMYTNGEMSIHGYNVNYQTTYTFVQSSNCLLFYVEGSQLAAAYRDCAIISLQHSHTKIMFDKDLFRYCGYDAAATLPPSTGAAEPNVVRKFLIYSKPKNYGYYADRFDVTRGLQDHLFFRYRNRILRIQDDLVRRSPEPQQMKDMYFALPSYTRSTSHSAKVYGQRAVQVLHYHAHSIQLFFRRVAERRRLGLLHFLMEQQTSISYLHCEYVMRDIAAFGI
jgi:hypothetical protein